MADPHSPYRLRGVGEPPTISSTPAIVAAVQAARTQAHGSELARHAETPSHFRVNFRLPEVVLAPLR